MKHRFFAVVILAALLFAGSIYNSAPSLVQAEDRASSTPVKIGGAFALSGGGSELDLPSANGAKLALKEINAAGGVLGRPVELIIRDSEYKPETTAEIAEQLVQEDKVVGVIGFNDTDSVLAAGPSIHAAGIPFVTVGATSPRLPAQIGNMMFLACFGDNVQAAAGAEYAVEKLGKTAVLLMDNGMDYTILLANYFKVRFTELGGSLILEEEYLDEATDFSAQIARLKALSKQPDFYYIAAMPYNIYAIVKQMREAGILGPIVGGDGYDTPDLLKVAGKAAENVFFTTHALMDPNGGTEGIKKFAAAYRTEYAHEAENAFAALGYDSMNLIVSAIKRAGSTEPQAIKKALEETKGFPGITGSITLSPESHIPLKAVTLVAVKDGRFTLGAEVLPQKVPAP